jgi:hypothetical protein
MLASADQREDLLRRQMVVWVAGLNGNADGGCQVKRSGRSVCDRWKRMG